MTDVTKSILWRFINSTKARELACCQLSESDVTLLTDGNGQLLLTPLVSPLWQMRFRLLHFFFFLMTGNIWCGQQSPPGFGGNFPPEFNIQTGCRCKQNESDVVKGCPCASAAWHWYCITVKPALVNVPSNCWRGKWNNAPMPLPLAIKIFFFLSARGHVWLIATKGGVGICLLSPSYSSDLEHHLPPSNSQHGSWKDRIRQIRPVLVTSASLLLLWGSRGEKSPKSRAGAEGEQADYRCGALERLKIILWSDGTER